MARPDQRVGITQASQELPEELSEIESSIEEDADRSYPEDFADDTGTGTLDRSEQRQSAAASPRSLTSDKEASYSEDFAEATLEATMEEALPTPDIPRATLDRRQEIALRQQADSKKVIVPLVPDDDDIDEEDIPEGGDFTEDDLEGSSSMYDPEVRRREMEKEEQQREEEERLRREQEQAEQARKQKEIEEANRRLAAERKRKLEEERKREEEDAFRRKQQEELQREEARRAEEQRKQAEEAERKREEERRKAEEQETRRREEERRKAEEETRRREEEQRKKSEEENRRREEERRKAEEETRKREEERKTAEEETKKREEEERRTAEEETKKREKEEAERRKAEEELLQKREAMRVIPSQVQQQAVASEEPEEPQKHRQMMEAQARELQENQPHNVEALVPEVLRSTEESPAKDSNFASPLVAGPGLRPRRFSGAWIQTELDTAGHLEDGESAPQATPWPEEKRSYQMEPSGQTELRSRPCTDNVWPSPKSQWDEQRTAPTTAGDRSYRTGWSSRWEQGDCKEWPDPDDWRGSWWDRDWHLQRDEEDFRPFEVRSQGRERWGSLGEDLPTWSQRRSRDLWPDTPGRWDKESWPQQDKENCLSQLGEWDSERVRRSPSRASGLWQSRPKAAWEAAAASFPNQTAALPQPLGIAPGFYGQPTPFGVLYPWGFAGSYPLPGTGPGPCVVAPPAMAESATLSPTGASPARAPPEEEQEEEAPKPPTANVLETTLPVGPSDLDFQESLVSAFAAVVDEMLQFKYGCCIDAVDYRAKLRSLCDASALCSMPRLVDAANSQKEFYALDASDCQVQLRLTCQELSSFGALCERLRMLPGTASAVVVISTRGGYAVQALAAFRPSCDLRHAVGRCGSGSGARALEHFAEEEFCSAVALEPTILSLQAPLGGPLREPPALTEEFRSLRQLLLGRPPGASGAGTQRSSGALAPQLLAALHARAPSALAFRHVASALAGNDVQPEVVDELFRRLVDWFRSSSPSVVAAAQDALAEAPAHVALVACLRKAPERRRLCELGCQLLARAARHHVENAAAFVGAGAAQLVCEMLDRHYGVKELQRCGLQALAILAHYGGGASQALAADALRLSLRALRAHRASASVQIAGCEVLRCLAELAEAPLEELSEAAQLAKRAFPEDSAVHRAADALLSFAIPRSAAAIGSLMDSATADETAQRNAICSLGHLAGYGGVAWRGASRVALNRILRAMAQHKGSAVLVASGLWALGRFAERVDAPRGGLQDAAQQAKKSHPNSALVGRHADELIAYLMRPQ